MESSVPYDEMDANIRSLVEVINRFPGLNTIDSCGGHPDAKPYQEVEGHWRVGMEVDHTEEGWRSLEFLAWAASDFRSSGHPMTLGAFSHPPYLNTPGQCLTFTLRGGSISPESFAETLDSWREEDYVAVEDDEAFQEYMNGDEDNET